MLLGSICSSVEVFFSPSQSPPTKGENCTQSGEQLRGGWRCRFTPSSSLCLHCRIWLIPYNPQLYHLSWFLFARNDGGVSGALRGLQGATSGWYPAVKWSRANQHVLTLLLDKKREDKLSLKAPLGSVCVHLLLCSYCSSPGGQYETW